MPAWANPMPSNDNGPGHVKAKGIMLHHSLTCFVQIHVNIIVRDQHENGIVEEWLLLYSAAGKTAAPAGSRTVTGTVLLVVVVLQMLTHAARTNVHYFSGVYDVVVVLQSQVYLWLTQ